MIVEITVKMKNGEVYKYNSQAEAIKKARIAAGLSQEQAAEKAGIMVQSWQKYEYGLRMPKDAMLERMAGVLGVDISVLTTFTGI